MGKRRSGGILEKQRELRKKKRRQRRRRRMAVLLAELAILSILGAAAYGMAKLGKLNHTAFQAGDLGNNGLRHRGYTNIALFGTDNRAGEKSGVRSDVIIVASIHNRSKEVRLLSVYRDTMLRQGKGDYDKANSAYARGGAQAAVRMLNENLDLDIEDYISVDFSALAKAVDLLGGIKLELTSDEITHMNNYCVETAKITGRDYEPIEPETAGTYKLNGVQAVSYARIRYTGGGDFERTNRQRLVLEKLMKKAQGAKLSVLNKLVDQIFPEISTSFTSARLIKLAGGVFNYKISESGGFPFSLETPEAVPGYAGSYVVAKGLEENVRKAHEFLFPNKKYEPTDKVRDISEELSQITGVYPKDKGEGKK